MFKRIPWKSQLPAFLPSASLAGAVFIGLGTNIGTPGQRRRIMSLAIQNIASLNATRILAVSSLYVTPPWGVVDQDDFTNAVVAINSSLRPSDLLRILKRIESKLGRKSRRRWGAREIDLDILIAGAIRIQRGNITVPHPQLCNRDFVLIPMKEIAPFIVKNSKCGRFAISSKSVS